MSGKSGVIFLYDGTPVKVSCESKFISDGSHSFADLYDIRSLLFCHLCHCFPKMAWRSLRNENGTIIHDGDMFLAGLRSPQGDVNFHLSISAYWHMLHGIEEKKCSPRHDGSSSKEQMERLGKWIESNILQGRN